MPAVILSGLWWRTYFQAVSDQTGGVPTDRQLRRWRVRGAIVWVLLSYVVLIVTVASYADGDSAENRNDDNASWPLVIVFYLLPVGMAAVTAGFGRMMVNVRPPGPDRP